MMNIEHCVCTIFSTSRRHRRRQRLAG